MDVGEQIKNFEDFIKEYYHTALLEISRKGEKSLAIDFMQLAQFNPDLAEEMLEETNTPHYNGVVDYGDRAEHCWNGDHDNGNHISRLRYHRMFIQKFVDKVGLIAPKGADLKSWRY